MKKLTTTIRSVTGVSRSELHLHLEYVKSLPYGKARLAMRDLMSLGLSGDASIDTPDWLIEGTNFFSNIWRLGFGPKSDVFKKTIDFNVRLSNGTLLTDKNNEVVFAWFKYFISVQIHPRYNGGSRKSAIVECRRVVFALQFIDWILLNDDVFNIGDFKLSHITIDALKGYLINKTSSPTSLYLYDYGKKLTRWLVRKIEHMDEAEFDSAYKKWPQILEVPQVSTSVISLTEEELRRVRAFIRIENMYWIGEGGGRFNDKFFIAETYVNTLHGRAICPASPEELRFHDTISNEYPRVPIREANKDGIFLNILVQHLHVLNKTLVVAGNYVDAGLNIEGIAELDATDLFQQAVKKTYGRYVFLPSSVMLQALGNSIEFVLEYGIEILKAMVLVVECMLSKKISRKGRASKLDKFAAGLECETLNKLGVVGWRIKRSRFPHSSHFEKLRKTPGIFEIYAVLLGAMLTVLGSLTARRQSEIVELLTEGCLFPFEDPNLPENQNLSYRFIYHGAKTGNRAKRQKLNIGITMPIARMLWMFIEFRQSCEKLSLVPSTMPLFFVISRVPNKGYKLTAWRYNDALDIACDYFQSPTVVLMGGVRHRYYIRQHQLRRFFAMSFFWSSGFDGLDTLRYALGHSDVEHIYRYITETTPGKILQSIKVERVCDAILHDTSDIENLGRLKSLLAKKFNGLDIVTKTPGDIAEDYGAGFGTAMFNATSSLAEISTEINLYDEVLQLFKIRLIDLQPEFFDYVGADGITSHRFNLVIKIKE